MKLNTIKCLSCGDTVTLYATLGTLVFKCPYCHQEMVNVSMDSLDVPAPDAFIPFRTGFQEYRQKLSQNLIEQDLVPANVFQSINPRNMVRVYLPMYLFKGTYEAKWDSMVQYSSTRQEMKKDGSGMAEKEVKEYKPTKGSVRGEYAFYSLAYNDKLIPESLRKFCLTFPYQEDSLHPFDDAQRQKLETDTQHPYYTAPIAASRDEVWQHTAQSILHGMAESKVKEDLSQRKFKKLQVEVTPFADADSPTGYVLVPFWAVYYVYQGRQHYFLMDGLSAHTSMSKPQDEVQLQAIRKNDYLLWAVWASVLLVFPFKWIFGWWGFFIYLLLWALASLFTWHYTKGRNQRIMDDARQQRRLMAGAQ